MPRYDYRCQACGTVFEQSHRFEQRPSELPCPGCSRMRPVHRLFAMPAIHYRTDGFHSYDNADPVTKYQREHFAESGDRSDKKLKTRRSRRGHQDPS